MTELGDYRRIVEEPRLTSLNEEIARLREHIRKQEADIMKLSALVYADGERTWKDMVQELLAAAKAIVGKYNAEDFQPPDPSEYSVSVDLETLRALAEVVAKLERK